MISNDYLNKNYIVLMQKNYSLLINYESQKYIFSQMYLENAKWTQTEPLA